MIFVLKINNTKILKVTIKIPVLNEQRDCYKDLIVLQIGKGKMALTLFRVALMQFGVPKIRS